MTPLTALDRSPLPPPSERLFGWPRAHQHHHPGGPPPGDPPQDPAFAAFDPKAYAAYHTSLEGQGPEELMTHYRDRGRKQNRCVGDPPQGQLCQFPSGIDSRPLHHMAEPSRDVSVALHRPRLRVKTCTVAAWHCIAAWYVLENAAAMLLAG